jgi:hypothetical protein
MKKKEIKTKIEGMINEYLVEETFEDESISRNICNSINDFYNLMHLIKNSWPNKNYVLKMNDAGYNIYDKNDNLLAWIGVKEKYEYIAFIIFGDTYDNILYENARKGFKGSMDVIEFNEDLWLYVYIALDKIISVENVENQQKILKSWIKEKIEKIL